MHEPNDYPPGLIGVYDNGGRHINGARSQDRYTAVFVPYRDETDGRLWWPLFTCCGNPRSAYGIGITGSVAAQRGRMVGERQIAFADLPKGAQESIADQAAEWLAVAAGK